MLEDMISVGPPASALEKYPQYEKAYYERKKTTRSKLATSNLKKEEEAVESGKVSGGRNMPMEIHQLGGGNQGGFSNS